MTREKFKTHQKSKPDKSTFYATLILLCVPAALFFVFVCPYLVVRLGPLVVVVPVYAVIGCVVVLCITSTMDPGSIPVGDKNKMHLYVNTTNINKDNNNSNSNSTNSNNSNSDSNNSLSNSNNNSNVDNNGGNNSNSNENSNVNNSNNSSGNFVNNSSDNTNNNNSSNTDNSIINNIDKNIGSYYYGNKKYSSNNKKSSELAPRVDVHVRGVKVTLRWCQTCHILRPPRASHCSECDRCIEQMDHHCPWVGNCVGKRNHRFFVLFVTSCTFLTLYVLGFSVLRLVWIVLDGKSIVDAIAESPVSMILAIYCFFLFWSVGILSFYHAYLVSIGVTTNEEIKDLFEDTSSPYSKGIFKNFVNFCFSPWWPSRMDMVKSVSKNYRNNLQNSDDESNNSDDEHTLLRNNTSNNSNSNSNSSNRISRRTDVFLV